MQVDHYVTQVQSQLVAAASLGGDTTRATGEALATAAEPAVRLALLGAVAAAADEITSMLLDSPGAPAVAVRLDGDDLHLEVRPTGPGEPSVDSAPTGADDGESTARISLRLPEALKVQIEAAARRTGVSVNTWIVRAVASALTGSGRGGRRSPTWMASPSRLTGWING
jgi:hypothetical protein